MLDIKLYRNRSNLGFWIAKQEDLGMPGLGNYFLCQGTGTVVCLGYFSLVIWSKQRKSDT